MSHVKAPLIFSFAPEVRSCSTFFPDFNALLQQSCQHSQPRQGPGTAGTVKRSLYFLSIPAACPKGRLRHILINAPAVCLNHYNSSAAAI